MAVILLPCAVAVRVMAVPVYCGAVGWAPRVTPVSVGVGIVTVTMDVLLLNVEMPAAAMPAVLTTVSPLWAFALTVTWKVTCPVAFVASVPNDQESVSVLVL